MANRLKWNILIRRIHFITSLLITGFMLFYIITGLIMSRYHWFPLGENITSINTLPLTYIADTIQKQKLGKDIKSQFAINGRLNYGNDKNGNVWYSIARPGVKYQVTLTEKLDSIRIKETRRETLGEISKRLHRTFGYEGGWKYFLWATIVDVAAMSAILFSLTGIFIWFRMRKNFKYGWGILIITFLLTTVMIIYLW